MTTANTTSTTTTTTTTTTKEKPMISHDQCKFFCLMMVALFNDHANKKAKDRVFDAEVVQEILGTITVTSAHEAAGKDAVSEYKNYTPAVLGIMAGKAAFWFAVADHLVGTVGVNIPQPDQDAKTRAKSLSSAIDYAKRIANRKDITSRDKVKEFWARAGVDAVAIGLLLPEEGIVTAVQVQSVQQPVLGFGATQQVQPQGQPVQQQQVQAQVQSVPQPQSNDRMTRMAAALKAAGFSAVEVAEALATVA